MAESSDTSEERQLDPTERRLERAREEGQFAQSRDLTTLIVLVLFTAFLLSAGGALMNGLVALVKAGLTFDNSQDWQDHLQAWASGPLTQSFLWVLAITVPLIGYALLRRFIKGFDAAAIAATYGSVSAVTFVTAVQYLEHNNIAYGGHMAAAMALMESPAIIMAVILANQLRHTPATAGMSESSIASDKSLGSIGKVLHESFTDGAQLLLLGAMAVGMLTGDAGKAAMQPFSDDLFKGMLSFFLLDMGLMAARNLPKVRGQSPVLMAYAVMGPIIHASLALALAYLSGLPVGDGALLMVLAASASYIAVPAVLRFALPEANPSLYFGLSLGVTFPLNILLGIPVYVGLAQSVL